MFFLIIYCHKSLQQPYQHCYCDIPSLDKTIETHHLTWLQEHSIKMIFVPSSDSWQALSLTAESYKALKNQTFDKVVLICKPDQLFCGIAIPCFSNSCVLADHDLKTLSKYSLFHYYQAAYNHNTSFLLQSCCINYYLDDIPVIPLVIGSISKNDACVIVEQLKKISTEKTLWVICTDIGCYDCVIDDCPVDQSKVCKVYDSDAYTIQSIQSKKFVSQVSQQEPLLLLFFQIVSWLSDEKLQSYFVGYDTSCKDDRGAENITSCASFIFYEDSKNSGISLYEQRQLLSTARAQLQDCFDIFRPRKPCMISYAMSQPSGVFVSLYSMSDHGLMLRGCMGSIESSLSLYDMVVEMTKLAALKDNRFCPLRAIEVITSVLSISVITDVQKTKSYDQLQSSDGIMLKYQDSIAIYLPSYETVNNWTYQSALGHLSNQIGLRHVWKKDTTQIFKFQSVIFQEE